MRVRGLHFLAASVLAAIAAPNLAAGGLGTGNAPKGAAWCERPQEILAELRAEGRPEFYSLHSLNRSKSARKDALAGEFKIAGRGYQLTFPVNWLQDPYHDRTWRFWLHSLIILEPLLADYNESTTVQALRLSKKISLDWIRQNGHDQPTISEFAWYDMAVAARTAYLAYILRAAAFQGELTADEVCRLGRSLEEHANWLAEPSHYAAGHNHGLYEDGGLYLAAKQNPWHPASKQWSSIASQRYLATVESTVDLDEGVHLEHSPAYHVGITRLLMRFRRFGLGGEKMRLLTERMKASAWWFVMPDGMYAQLGDTDLAQAPGWATDSEKGIGGLKVFKESGFAVVKSPSSYLILAAGYHGSGHKHADELTFSLFDRGQRIVIDSGRYGYYYSEPGRKYAVSSRSHNTVEIDGADFTWRGSKPYGSGILGGGSSSGWYAMEGENKLLQSQGVLHRRLVLYKPEEAVVVLDRVESNKVRSVRRHFHFSPQLKVTEEGARRFDIIGDGIRGAICDRSGEEPIESKVVSGQTEPTQGFTFPANRLSNKSPTVLFDTAGLRETWVTVLDLTDRGWCAAGYELSAEYDQHSAFVRIGPQSGLRLEVSNLGGEGDLSLKVSEKH